MNGKNKMKLKDTLDSSTCERFYLKQKNIQKNVYPFEQLFYNSTVQQTLRKL